MIKVILNDNINDLQDLLKNVNRTRTEMGLNVNSVVTKYITFSLGQYTEATE